MTLFLCRGGFFKPGPAALFLKPRACPLPVEALALARNSRERNKLQFRQIFAGEDFALFHGGLVEGVDLH